MDINWCRRHWTWNKNTEASSGMENHLNGQNFGPSHPCVCLPWAPDRDGLLTPYKSGLHITRSSTKRYQIISFPTKTWFHIWLITISRKSTYFGLSCIDQPLRNKWLKIFIVRMECLALSSCSSVPMEHDFLRILVHWSKALHLLVLRDGNGSSRSHPYANLFTSKQRYSNSRCMQWVVTT